MGKGNENKTNSEEKNKKKVDVNKIFSDLNKSSNNEYQMDDYVDEEEIVQENNPVPSNPVSEPDKKKKKKSLFFDDEEEEIVEKDPEEPKQKKNEEAKKRIHEFFSDDDEEVEEEIEDITDKLSQKENEKNSEVDEYQPINDDDDDMNQGDDNLNESKDDMDLEENINVFNPNVSQQQLDNEVKKEELEEEEPEQEINKEPDKEPEKEPEINENVNVNSSKPDMDYISKTLNQAGDKMKNALGNVIDIEDDPEEEEPEKKEPDNQIPEREEPEIVESGSINDNNQEIIESEKKNPEIKDNVNVNSSKPDMNYINQTLNQAEDKMKNALGNVIDIEDEPEEEEPEKNEPENSQPENNEPKEDEINIEGLEGHDINSMEIDEEIHYEEPKTKLQQAEDKVNSFLNDDSLEDEKKPEKTETVDDIQKKTDEIASKVDEIVKEPLSNKEPEKKEPEAEKSDNGVPEPYSPEPDEKMLPKQQLNHLSDMIDSINERNGTAFSAKGTRKFLSNQFKAGKGETLAEQRETFKTSYTNFCKDAFENMMEKRAKMPLKDRPSLEQSLADFQKYTKQLENLSKANGWMQKDVEMGPYGGLESSEIKKMQKAALDKEPKSTMDAVRNELVNAKDRTKALSEFSKNFKDQVAKVPAADKESSVQGPEASQAIAKLKALNDVHNNRTRGFRFAHPILYRREGKLLDSTQKALEAKGYDREVIAQMLKAPDTQDPVKEQYDKDAKSIDDIAKKTKKEIKSFEERKEKEDELVRKHVKGMRKQISVPEADNSKDLVNVPKEMKSPAVQKKLDIQKTNNLQVSGKGK